MNAGAQGQIAPQSDLVAVLQALAVRRTELARTVAQRHAEALVNLLAVDEGAVLAAEILHPHFRRIDTEQAMMARDVLVVEVVRKARRTVFRAPQNMHPR